MKVWIERLRLWGNYALGVVGAVAAVGIVAYIIGFTFWLGGSASSEAGPTVKQTCVQANTLINAATFDAARSFNLNFNQYGGGFDVLSIYLEFTDANSSVTRFDGNCTTSLNGNTTDFEIQDCAVAAGVCTSSDTEWQKATPGTANWVWRVDVSGYQDVECTFDVGAGAGAAADLLTAHVRA